MAGHRPPRGPWVWGGVQAVPPETTASGELGGEAMWRFCAGLEAGEPSSLTGVSALLWFPGLAHSAPLPLQALHRATVKWEGSPPLRQFSACPESLGMPAREHWASGELCFLASEALQSLGCRRETGGQHSLRLGTTGRGGQHAGSALAETSQVNTAGAVHSRRGNTETLQAAPCTTN